MNYSFTEILAIEQVLNKAIGAAKAFADRETTKKLSAAAHIFEKLRHAAGSAELGAPVRPASPPWIADEPPESVEVAWLRLASPHPEVDWVEYVVLGCRSGDEGIWCVAADWKAKSHDDPIEDYITHWMPYAVPSSAV